MAFSMIGIKPVVLVIQKGSNMKRKMTVRERNCFVRLALFRKAGVHRKSNKALRKAQNQEQLGGETLR